MIFPNGIFKQNFQTKFSNGISKQNFQMEILFGNSVWKFCMEILFGNFVWKFCLEIYLEISFGNSVCKFRMEILFGRPTDRRTERLLEAPSRSLKKSRSDLVCYIQYWTHCYYIPLFHLVYFLVLWLELCLARNIMSENWRIPLQALS